MEWAEEEDIAGFSSTADEGCSAIRAVGFAAKRDYR